MMAILLSCLSNRGVV